MCPSSNRIGSSSLIHARGGHPLPAWFFLSLRVIAGGPDEVHLITVVKLDCSYVQASVGFWLCRFPCLKIYNRAFSSVHLFICSSVISVVFC